MIEQHHRETAKAQLEAAIESLKRTLNLIETAAAFRPGEYPTPDWREAVEKAWVAAGKTQRDVAKVAVR